MQIGGPSAPVGQPAARPAAKPGVLARLESAAQATKGLLEAQRSAADEQKARAKERLERARQFLAMLKRMGFPPEVVARLAAELAREVGAAAQEFAALAGSGTGLLPGGEPSALQADSADAPETDTPEDEARDDDSFVRKAYLEAMDEGPERPTMSMDDRKTMSDFEALMRELRALVEKARREMQDRPVEPDAVDVENAMRLLTAAATSPEARKADAAAVRGGVAI